MAALLTVLLLASIVPLPAAQANALAQSPWVEMENPAPGEPLLPTTPDGRHMRVRLDVMVPPGSSFMDLPVTHTLDIAHALGEMAGHPRDPHSGQLLGFELDLESFTLIEVDGDGNGVPVPGGGKGRIPVQVFRGSFSSATDFDARANPVVTLRWMMPGQTTGDRHFHVYFDAIHNGERAPDTPDPKELGRIAASVGPGRGTHAYVPLPGVIGGTVDSRRVHVTNLQDRTTTVQVFEYDPFSGLPGDEPTALLTLPAEAGATHTYSYRPEYRSTGFLFLNASGPIVAEASHGGIAAAYQAGSTTLFVPASDGGFVGSSFVAKAQVGAIWFVYCHSANLPEGQTHCQGTFRRGGQGGTFSIPAGTHQTLPVSGGEKVTLQTTVGQVAVQRVTTGPGQRSMQLWPPIDGVLSSSSFMGHALAVNPAETLMIASPHPDAALFVKDMAGAKRTLAESWLVGQGLFKETDTFGARWSRSWDGSNTHDSGGVRIEAASPGDPATRGLTVINGEVDHDDLAGFSAMVPLQSADGGLHYTFHVPADRSGQPLGRLVLFAPYPATTATVSVSGASATSKAFNLQQHQYLDTWQEMAPAAGRWSIQADRPVLAVWLKAGVEPMAGFVPTVTDLARVEATAAQAIGQSFDLRAEPTLRIARALDEVSFTIAVTNHARAADGTPLTDQVRLSIDAPEGWDSIQISPGTLELGRTGGEDATQTATVRVKVPSHAGDGSGAVLRLVAKSIGSQARGGGLEVSTDLIINILQQHGVQVVADGGFTSRATKTVEEEGRTWAAYRVAVRNTGGSADSFNIRFPHGNPEWHVDVTRAPGTQPPNARCRDLFDADAMTPAIPPGGEAIYEVNVSLDPDAPEAFRFTGFVTAVSVEDCSAFDSVQLVTEVEGDHRYQVDVEDPERTVKPGTQTTFRIDIHNLAESKEELNVTLGGPSQPGWPAPTVSVHLSGPTGPSTPLDPTSPLVSLLPLTTVRISVTQHVPEDAQPLLMALDRLFLRSTSPSGSADEVALRITAAKVVGFDAYLDPQQLAVMPGEPAAAELVVTSAGNVAQTLHLDTAPVSGASWTVSTPSGQPFPHAIELGPRETLRVPLVLGVPADAPPSATALDQMALRIASPGVPTTDVPVRAAVEERAAAQLLQDGMSATPGRTTRIDVPVRNVGNVPLRLGAELVELDADWVAQTGLAELPVGEETVLPVSVSVPTGTAPGLRTVGLRIMDDVQQLGLVPFRIHIGRPAIDARVASVDALGAGFVYRVDVSNHGDAPAYGVVAVLMDGSRPADRDTINEILPSQTHRINLVTAEALSQPSIQVTADHDKVGVELRGDSLQAVGGDRGMPGPAGVAVAASVVLAVLAKRRRA